MVGVKVRAVPAQMNAGAHRLPDPGIDANSDVVLGVERRGEPEQCRRRARDGHDPMARLLRARRDEARLVCIADVRSAREFEDLSAPYRLGQRSTQTQS